MPDTILETRSYSTEETISAAENLGRFLKDGDIVLLVGDIGAGKTQFAKGLAKGLGVIDINEVNSPTYDLVHTFEARLDMHHIDLYRLETVSWDDRLWIEEYFEIGGICVIEWGERLLPLSTGYYLVTLFHCEAEEDRDIKIERFDATT